MSNNPALSSVSYHREGHEVVVGFLWLEDTSTDKNVERTYIASFAEGKAVMIQHVPLRPLSLHIPVTSGEDTHKLLDSHFGTEIAHSVAHLCNEVSAYHGASTRLNRLAEQTEIIEKKYSPQELLRQAGWQLGHAEASDIAIQACRAVLRKLNENVMKVVYQEPSDDSVGEGQQP